MVSRLVLRLTAPLIIVSVLLLAVGGFAAWYVHRLQQEASALLADSIRSADAAQRLENSLRDLQYHLNEYVFTGNRQHINDAVTLHEQTEIALSDTERFDVSKDGKQLLIELREQYTVFSSKFQKVVREPSVDEDQSTVSKLVKELVSDQLVDRAQQHHDAQKQRVAAASDRSQIVADRVSLTLLLLGTSGAVGGLVFGFGVARGLQRSIVDLSVPVHWAAGALNEVVGPLRVSITGNIEELRTSLDTVAEQVAATVERLQASQRDNLRAEQLAAVGQLAAGLAHELRNPLTAMKTLVQTAREQGGASTLDDRDLQILEEEISRLNETVQTFLDYARPPQLRRQMVDVGELVDRTVHLVSPRAEQQRVRIHTQLPKSLPRINGDAEQLKQVLLNLMLNAIDAQPTGGRVEVSAATDGADMLQLEVRDEGAGIAATVRDRIFEPFLSTKEAGTGLGLPICKRIVEEHGGRITAINSPDGGAMFSVWLPIGRRESTTAVRRTPHSESEANDETQYPPVARR